MPAKGGPTFSTGIITAASGFEQRNQWWSKPRRKWDIAISATDEEGLEIVKSFFYVAGGRANGFRKRDWTDYQLVDGVIGIGDSSETIFQLKKVYTIGPTSVSVDIKKPVTASVVDFDNNALTNTVKIYFDDVEQMSGFTVNHQTGEVTFTSAPGTSVVITADCEFDIPVRFDTDQLEATINEDGIYTFGSVPLIEVRV